MTVAAALLDRMKVAGLSVKAVRGNLDIQGPQAAIDALPVDELRAHKAELLVLLSLGSEPTVTHHNDHRAVLAESIKWIPLGHLLTRSPDGGWFVIAPGIWQHYVRPPTEDELEDERAWLRKREQGTSDAVH